MTKVACLIISDKLIRVSYLSNHKSDENNDLNFIIEIVVDDFFRSAFDWIKIDKYARLDN